MKYKATESFLHDELGAIAKGDEVTATPNQAVTPLMLGYFQPCDAKPAREATTDAEKAPAKAKK